MKLPKLTRKSMIATAAAVSAVALVPGAAFAGHFVDIGDNVHKENIEWLEDKGITTGCTDTEYCPEDFVKRGQMATFIRRVAGQDPDVPPMVNADKVDGLDASSLALAGYANGTSETPIGPGTPVTAQTVVISVPEDGHLVIGGGVDLTSTAGEDATCMIEVDETLVTGTDRSVNLAAGEIGQCTTQGGIEVTAGDYTVELLAGVTGELGNSGLTVEFVPFDVAAA